MRKGCQLAGIYPFIGKESRDCGFTLFDGVLAGLGGRGWQTEHGSQRPAGVTFGTCGDVLGGAGGNDLPALVAGVGAEVNDPIGGLHDVEVVLDDEHGVAGIHEPLKDLKEHAHVVEVQAGGRLVEQEQGGGGREEARIERGVRSAECGVRWRPACVGANYCFGKVADEFQPLALTAGEGVDGLAQLEVAEPHFFQQLQRLDGALGRARFGKRGQEGDDFLDGGFEHVGDGEGA